MRATIRQVAERAGVSRTTVSNVMLGRTDQATSETCEAVMRAVRELDYVPVKPVLQNRNSHTNIIAVPVNKANRVNWGVNRSTHEGIYEAAMHLGYDVLMLMRQNPDWAKDRGQVQLLDRRSDGIIFASPIIGESEETFVSLARRNIPTVACFRRDVPESINWVDPDNQAIVVGGLQHLVSHGHRKIAYLTELQEVTYDNTLRREVFQTTMRQWGMPENAELIFGGRLYSIADEVVDAIIASGVTAVMGFNDYLAGTLRNKLEARGIGVPDAISLVGVDGYEAPQFNLDSMEFRFEEVGYKALEMLVERINGAPWEECNYSIQPRLVVRGSVRQL